MSITICVFIGLPAAGKSTIRRQLELFLKCNETHICNIEYDALIPDNISSLQLNQWKDERSKIVTNVECSIRYLQELHLNSKGVDLLKNIANIENFKNCLCPCFETCNNVALNHIFLIDDNMFYRSMRYPYYQLARRYECSYSQMYLQAPIDELIARNQARGSSVTRQTILKMYENIETPKPLKYAWENQSLTIETSIDVNVCTIADFILESSKIKCTRVDPFSQLRIEDRKKCLESFVHQVDQTIRKYISKVISQMKTNSLSKELLSIHSKSLNVKRKHFLTELKRNNFSVNDELEMIVGEFHGLIENESESNVNKASWNIDVERCFSKYVNDSEQTLNNID